MDNWIDKHSINCCVCDKLIDEREAISFIGSSEYCQEHHEMVVTLTRQLCDHLTETSIYSVYVDDNETEIMYHNVNEDWADTLPMDDALAMLKEALDTVHMTPQRYLTWHTLSTLIGA